jgi:hypothetical protein
MRNKTKTSAAAIGIAELRHLTRKSLREARRRIEATQQLAQEAREQIERTKGG